ncbi:MAG TPA: hypothetical protein VFD70_05935, partial [Anaerolineae bacterium]|nr:hypothetical protein [Anaerolineae bacterium]
MNKSISFGLIGLLVVVIIAGIASQPFDAAAAGTTIVSDSFTRNVRDSWGNAPTGGTYSLSGGAANFDVPDVVGQMNLGKNTTLTASLPVSARDVDVKVRVKRNKGIAGGNQMAYFAVRRTATGTNYLGRIRFVTDGTVRLQAIAEVGGTQTMLGGEKIVSGVTTAANSYIWLRGQVTGANPTTVKLKAWAQGASEPSSWLYTITDSTAALQGAGGAGL